LFTSELTQCLKERRQLLLVPPLELQLLEIFERLDRRDQFPTISAQEIADGTGMSRDEFIPLADFLGQCRRVVLALVPAIGWLSTGSVGFFVVVGIMAWPLLAFVVDLDLDAGQLANPL
jgi:hypothetical protein